MLTSHVENFRFQSYEYYLSLVSDINRFVSNPTFETTEPRINMVAKPNLPSESCPRAIQKSIGIPPSFSLVRRCFTLLRFRRELQGVDYETQAADPTEVDLESLRERPNLGKWVSVDKRNMVI
ncbi:hypothetical protein YC2023_035886 [Brassica napus]